ncbi:MAG: LON peptidase substrate-binding domain-containing protein [Candidatus Limnocylindrales bacterium]
MELPLFPLHTVLCPGVALPLHVFEERYRRLVGRCLDAREPFGVVLIREGREVGSSDLRLARVGTTALIREAGRYPDGRFELMTVGGRRFHIDAVAQGREQYLVADVEVLEEPIGDATAARRLSHRVSTRFLEYLELLQPALADASDGPEIEVEIVVEPADQAQPPVEPGAMAPLLPLDGALSDTTEISITTGSDAERRDLLMAAARRLVTPDDPTALSYVLTGLVQLELRSRQALLEAPDTERRLRQLEALLGREIDLLRRQLKPLVVDPATDALRRN